MTSTADILDRTSGKPAWAMWWIAAMVVAIVAVTTAPLAAYVVLIALFGLPHVLTELRYCDERFSPRISVRLIWAMGLVVGLIALGRIAVPLGYMPASLTMPVELSLGAVLAGIALMVMRRLRVLGALIALALGLGAYFAPLSTFLVVAWAHNLTPLGFVAEITQGAERRRLLTALTIPFFIMPALIAAGGLLWVPQFFSPALDHFTTIFGAGTSVLMSFLPPGMDRAAAVPLFQAAVFSQVMHYFAVIIFMPFLLKEKGGATGKPVVPWPRWPVYFVAVGIASLFSFGFYAIAYTDARAAYGAAAAVHTWIELPLFLLALGYALNPARASGSPRPQTPH